MQNNAGIQTDTQKIKKQVRLRNITLEAQSYFAQKSMAEEFDGLRLFCMYALVPLSLLSMLNAVGLFISPTQSTQAFVFMLAMAILLVALIELAKTYSFIKAMKQFYTKGITSSFIFFFVLFVGGLTLSVYTSIQGAQEMVKNFDMAQARQELKTDSLKASSQSHYLTTFDQTEKTHTAHIASLKADYTRRIQAEQQGLQEYKNSVTWEGKINIHNPANAYNINAYQERITNLQAQLSKEIDNATKQHASRLQKLQESEKQTLTTLAQKHKEASAQNAKNQTFSVWFWAIVSGANELLIIFCSWFPLHYLYMCKREPEILLEMHKETNAFRKLSNYIFMFDLQEKGYQDLEQLRQDLPNHLPKNHVGFEVGRQDNSKDLPKSYNKSYNKTYAKTYQDLPPTLEEAIKQGFTHTPSLTQYYGVSINQVHETRKAIEQKPNKSLIITDLFSEKGGVS